MNRLWVRLSLAFGAVILMWVAVIVLVPPLVIRYSSGPEFTNPHTSKAYTRLAGELAQFYESHHGWDGVGTFLAGARAALPPSQSRIMLADAEGSIIYDVDGSGSIQKLDPAEEDKALPVQVDGRTIIYLAMRPVADSSSSGSDSFLLEQLLRFLLLAAVIGGPCAILTGMLMSRSLTAPLNRLANAARAIGSGDFSRRVEVVGTAEMVEVAQAFNEMVSALEQAETLRRNLIADVAHELRTPLTVLQGNLRAILDDVYPLDKVEITGLYDQTRHLGRLVNDLRELTQAEARQLPLDLQPVDMASLAHSAVATFGPVAEAKSVTLTACVPDGLPPVLADSARLTQVLYNLLTNALRHTPTGGTITVRAGRDGGTFNGLSRVWLTVQDSGDGIAPEHLPHVFERFYRADPARDRDVGGAGLGLAVARAIVEAHRGQITAASDGVPGHGSTFTVRLPLQRPA